MARTMISTAASFDARLGAKPPSSPWPVAYPASCRSPRSAANTSAPARSASEYVDDIRDGIPDALATVPTLVAVAQLDRLVQAGRGSRGDAGPAEGAVLEADVHLDRRIAARIEDLPRRDPRDGRLHLARAAFD